MADNDSSNPFDDAAAGVMHTQASQIRNNIIATQGQNPDQAANYQHLAQFTNTPLQTVYAQPDAIKNQAAMQQLDTGKLTGDYPHLAQFLTDQNNTAKSHDDIPTLAGVEGTAKAIPQAAPASAAPNFEAPDDPSNPSSGVNPIDFLTGLGASANRLEKAMNLTAGAFPTLYDKAASLITGQNQTAASDAYFARMVAPLDRQITALQPAPDASVLSKVTYGAGNLLGNIASVVLTGGESAAAGIGEAGTALQGTAAVAGQAAKSMAVPAISGAVNTGNDVYQQTGSVSAAIKAASASYATNTAMGILPLSAAGNLATRVATGFPAGVITGEANRQLMNAALPASMQTGFDPTDALVNGITGSALAGVMGHGPVQGALQDAHDNGLKAAQSEQTMQSLQDLSQMASDSKLRDRDPQAFHNFVQNISDDGQAPTDLYVDASKFNDVLKQSGVTPEQLAVKMPDVASQLAEATQTQGYVRIPVADFATHIAGGPLEAGLLPDMKTDPDGMTYSEGQEYLQQRQDEAPQLAQEIAHQQSAADDRQSQVKAIQDDIQGQLDATGHFPESITKAYASMHGAWYDTTAGRLGITPAELHEQFPLKVEGTAGGELSQQSPDMAKALGMSEDDYIKAVNPEGKTLAPDDHMVVHTGDIEPQGATKHVTGADYTDKDGRAVTIHEDAQGNMYAKANGETVGMIGPHEDGETVVDVTSEAQGKGVGTGLVKAYITRHPLAESGGFSPAGEATRRAAFRQLKAEQTLRQGDRGGYSPADMSIHLLKDADLSTFLHESGHFYLEAMHDIASRPGAPQGVKDDFDTLLQSFKTEGDTPEARIAAWTGKDVDAKRAGHEQFAEGFERYLMDGKAPTPELQGLFGRFRSWLLNIYRNFRGPGSEISPEVRAVMDRMLATEDAITQAEKTRSYAAIDLNGEQSPDVEQYKALGQEATQQAVADMQSRSMRDLRWVANAKSAGIKALQREAKTQRAAIREQATKEVEAQPIEQARDMIRAQRVRAPEDVEALKAWDAQRVAIKDAARTSAKEQLLANSGGVKGLEKGQFLMRNKRTIDNMAERNALDWEAANPKPIGKKAEVKYDLLAEHFGFNSGAELAAQLKTEPSAKVKIEGLTQQRMLEQHGELTDPLSIERAAEAAIHNEARAKMMATGLKILTKSPISSNLINKAAKDAADTAVAAKKIGELRPAQYSAAEGKANKALLKLAPKDPLAAAQAQRAALLNNRLFKSASEAVTDVQKGLAYLKRFTKDSVRGKIDVDVRDQIDDLLARFDLRANPTDTPTRAQVNLEKWIESQAEAGMQPSVSADLLNPAYRTPYREMTVESFRGMVDTVKSMEHMGKERNTLTIDGEKRDLKDFINSELVPKLQEHGERFSTDDLYTKPEDQGKNALAVKLDHFTSWMRGLDAQLKPQEFKRNEYDRHELLGPFGKSITEPVIQANYHKVDMLKGLSDDFREQARELGPDWQKSLTEMLPNDKLIDDIATKAAGEPVYMKLSKGRLLTIATHVGNESNFDKLTKGYNWEQANVWKMLHDHMTGDDWKAVQKIWDLYEKHWPETEAMYRRLGQTIPDKIAARPFQTPFGEQRGGYAAIKYDPLRSKRGERDAAGESINPAKGLFGSDYFSRSTTTNGSMNKRVDGYTDAIDLDFRSIERSMHDTIHDLAYREALINTNKIIEHADFRREFMKAYGREDYKALQDWIGRLANSENSDRAVGALGRVLSYTRTGMVMNAIALRATTVLKHGGSAGIKTLGYFAGGGEKYLASRFAAMGTDYRNQISGAQDKFPEIRARLLQQDRDYKATASSLFEKEGLQSRAERFGHSAVAWADMMTAVPTAWAAYDRAVSEGIPVSQGGTGEPMTEAQAVAYANKIVREAHGSNVESARSNIMTVPSEGVKLFTTLYGFMNNTYGQIADSVSKFNTPGIGKPEVLARTFMALIVPALWAEYLSSGAPKDAKAPSWMEFVGKAITGEVAGTVPLVRDAWSMAQGFSHAGVVGAESWLSTMVEGVKAVGKVAEGEGSKGKPVQAIADAVGMGLHIPGLGQIGKSAQYLMDVHTGAQPKPANAAELIKNTLVGPPKID